MPPVLSFAHQLLSEKNDPELYPYRRGLYFAFYNALNWQVATGTPTVLFMAYLGADSFQTGLVFGWPPLLTPVPGFATLPLPRLGFKPPTMAGVARPRRVPLPAPGLSPSGRP